MTISRRALFLLIPLAIAACDPITAEKSTDSGKGYKVKQIDDCEYIEVSYAPGLQTGYYSLTHKGDCKNAIHRCPPQEVDSVTEIKP